VIENPPKKDADPNEDDPRTEHGRPGKVIGFPGINFRNVEYILKVIARRRARDEHKDEDPE
jgi:hypothetical protein